MVTERERDIPRRKNNPLAIPNVYCFTITVKLQLYDSLGKRALGFGKKMFNDRYSESYGALSLIFSATNGIATANEGECAQQIHSFK